MKNKIRNAMRWSKENNKEILLAIYAYIFCLFTFLRVFDNAFWGDEGYSIMLANCSFMDMLHETAGDVHPPLYYAILWFTRHLIGQHRFMYPFLSFMPYFITVLICCIWIGKKFGAGTALVMLAGISMTPSAIHYNLEVRMYSWAALFVLLCFLSMQRAFEEDRWFDYVNFTLWGLCAAYTHYYALVTVAFFYVGLLIHIVRHRKSAWRKVALVWIVTVLSYLPWLYVLIKTFIRSIGGWWLGEIPSLKECISFLFVNIPVFVLFVIIAIGVVVRNVTKKQLVIDEDCTIAIWGIISTFGTIAIGISLSYLVRPFFLPRYLYPAYYVLWMGCGILVCKMNRNVLPIMLSLLIVTISIPNCRSVIRADMQLNQQTAEFQSIVDLPDHAIIYTNSWEHYWTLLAYYYEGCQPKYIKTDLSNIQDVIISQEKTAYLMLYDELNSETKTILDTMGYNNKFIYRGLLGNQKNVCVYELTSK